MVTYALDPGARLIDDDRVLIAGSPLSIFRLTKTGGQLVRRLTGEQPPAMPTGETLDTVSRGDPDRSSSVRPPATPTGETLDTVSRGDPDQSSSARPPATPTGKALDEASRRGADGAVGAVGALTAAEQRLVDRLVDAGALHPLPADGAFTGSIAVVVPVLDPTPEQLDRLATTVDAWLADLGPIVTERLIVDDASRSPVAAPVGWSVIRRSSNGGPAAARNLGVEHVVFSDRRADVVIFLDLDTAPRRGAAALLGHLGDPRVALVAARLVSRLGPSMRERYEAWRSPLDLGPQPGRVRAGTRVSYVPAAALAVRVDAFESVGGFETSLRFGEDVDLVWRLDRAGWRCRYEPEATVEHDPRLTWRAWWRQRVGYGSSAAPLAARHPGALAPARVSGWTAAVWGLAGLGHPVAAVAVAGATMAALVRKLPGLRDPKREAVRLAGLGHLYGGRILASALWRAWWPFALVAAVLSRRARRAVVAAAVIPAALDWRRDRPDLDPVRAVGLRVADDLAYGVGLWRGVVKARSLAAIRPDLSNWPPKPKQPSR